MFLQILLQICCQHLVDSAVAQVVQGLQKVQNPTSPFRLNTLKDVWLTVWVPLNHVACQRTCSARIRMSQVLWSQRLQHDKETATTAQWAHLSAFCPDSNMRNYDGSGQRCHHPFFGLSIYFSHTQILINTVGRVPQPDIKGCTLPFFKKKK